MSTKPSRTREQNAVGELLDRESLIRPNLATAAEKVPTVLPYFDLLTNATACFGQCKLVARDYDRVVALDFRAERRDGLLADVGKHNDAGLAQVTFARSALAQMGKEITAAKLSKNFVRQAPGVRGRVPARPCRLGHEGHRRQEDRRCPDRGHRPREQDGGGCAPGYIDGKLAELEEVRKRPDRRTLRSTFVGVSWRRSGAAAAPARHQSHLGMVRRLLNVSGGALGALRGSPPRRGLWPEDGRAEGLKRHPPSRQ